MEPKAVPTPSPSRRSALRRRFGRLVLIALLAFLGLGAGLLWAANRQLERELAERGIRSLAQLEEKRPVGGTLVFAANGDTLCSFYREKRVNVELDELPQHLKMAVLSVEDWRFYRHWGIDLFGLARAASVNLRRGYGAQGASTLTQQLARNLFLSHEQTIWRKIKEAMLALRIERTYTKNEIFCMYLNQIYFGEGAHGIEAAARTYYGKPARDLDLVESATLAGLPKNPNNYSPLDHPERAERRRNVVLGTMLEHRIITRAQHDSLVALPFVTHPGHEGEASGAYFAEEVRKYLEAEYGAGMLYEGELRVYTTLDPDLQRSAERALETRFRELEDTLGLPHPRREYLAARDRGLDPQARYLQGAVVALDPKTGRVLAMVGGRSFLESRFNRAVQARRQPGSCFKPFVFATAVQKGTGPSDILQDTPLVLELGGGRGLYKPQNYSQTFSGPVSVRTALAKSLNVPSIKLLMKVGPDAVIANARRMGISTPLEPVLSLALGTSEVTLLDLSSAYGTLANGGIASRPYFIERIEERDGKTKEPRGPYHEEALDPQTAFVVTHMLESAIEWGTGHNARDLYGLSVPAAGKTGTTDDMGDGWFVGYTPDLVVGVWGGFDERRPIGAAGAYIALPPWCDIMREYYSTHPARPFTEPPGIVAETICVDSGKLATAHCPRVQSEIFSERTRPTRECDLHSVASAGRDGDTALESLDDASMRARELDPPPAVPAAGKPTPPQH